MKKGTAINQLLIRVEKPRCLFQNIENESDKRKFIKLLI